MLLTVIAICVAVLGLQLFHGGLVRIDLRLERRLLKKVEKIIFLYLGAFDKESLYQERGDPGNERHSAHRLNAADELVGLSNLLALGAHHPDRWWTARRGLRHGWSGKHQERCKKNRHPCHRSLNAYNDCKSTLV